mgnify:CR=1 FL=1
MHRQLFPRRYFQVILPHSGLPSKGVIPFPAASANNSSSVGTWPARAAFFSRRSPDTSRSTRSPRGYRAVTYATQKIIRQSNVTERSLVTTCRLLNSSRSDDNPNGFTIEGFTIIENKDLQTIKR